MSGRSCLTVLLVGAALHATGADARERGPAELDLPRGIATYADGRRPIEELYVVYAGLVTQGWELEVVAQSQPSGTSHPLPVVALRSSQQGPATWILAGIHGEEPAGPNAIAAAIDAIAALGRQRPVVLLPLCNPQGYVRNWRYLNVATYSDAVAGQSVGDSSHLLPDPKEPARARAAGASSAEAEALTRFVLRLASTYPPRYSIDLHEDNLINAGYVYSQGRAGAADPLAIEATRVLGDTGIPLKRDGQTRFGETIVDGVVGPVADSSIDELMSSATLIIEGGTVRGPAARTVLVFETPAAEVTLARRIAAHEALLRRLTAFIARQ